MVFTVLTDTSVKSLLSALSRTDILEASQTLSRALAKYSAQQEDKHQPHRASVSRPDGQVTLFMAATSPTGVATKIVGCPPPSGTATSIQPSKTLRSVLTLCDAEGGAYGIINAAELTAFRTSLGSMLLYPYRKSTKNVVVFGAGKQAPWHIRLALLLRGQEIEKISVVNRSPSRSAELLQTLRNDDHSKWNSTVSFETFEPSRDDLELLLADSDVIFCTTPSRQPLFPASSLLSEKASKKSRYVTAIGSYTLDMSELDPLLLKSIVDKSAVRGSFDGGEGLIVVDSREGCFQEAGEIVQAALGPESLLEVGEIPGLLASRAKEGLGAWLEDGFVVYKSVGLGVMDLSVGDYLVSLSKQKDIGTRLSEF